MSLSWLPNTTQGTMVGDYISTSFLGAPAYPAFALANAPSGGVFDEATYTVRGGLTPTAAPTPATDRADSGGNATLTTSALTSQ
jgi:hypothetical protein